MKKVISGAQTGADRAALRVALELGMECGGWCPKGRRSEAGAIPECFPVKETPSANYEERTRWNVRDSDGTLLLLRGAVRKGSGTAFTIAMARKMKKPFFCADPFEATPDQARAWIEAEKIEVLNVAGPRESGCPGLEEASALFLHRLLEDPALYSPTL